MDQNPGKSLSPIGFLNAVESTELGLLGGYLVVSAEGRPLEFRCTTPVRPSRAQEILYGAALTAHLHSDVLGLPLLTGARLRPSLILTPAAAWRQLAWHVDAQVVQLTQPANCDDPVGDGSNRAARQQIGPYLLHLAEGQRLSEDAVASLEQLHRSVALDEPFERIQLALEEVLATTASNDEQAGPYDAAA